MLADYKLGYVTDPTDCVFPRIIIFNLLNAKACCKLNVDLFSYARYEFGSRS